MLAFARALALAVIRKDGERVFQFALGHEQRRSPCVEGLACLRILARIAVQRQVVGGIGRRAREAKTFSVSAIT